jgi:phytoene dehydrogenase-like protein
MAVYDGVILGAGHNGLILAAYLGKAGLSVVTIERRAVASGGLSTLEDPRHPGFLHNTHAFFARAVTAMPWYTDLALERRGAHMIEPELNVALLTGDGRALEWWTDIKKTIESFARFCGSSSHPGGNITGLPAYNAAQVILSDLGITADWMPAPIAERLAAM